MARTKQKRNTSFLGQRERATNKARFFYCQFLTLATGGASVFYCPNLSPKIAPNLRVFTYSIKYTKRHKTTKTSPKESQKTTRHTQNHKSKAKNDQKHTQKSAKRPQADHQKKNTNQRGRCLFLTCAGGRMEWNM